MAKTGFTLADNLENITAGKLAMTNLLSVGALPFQFDDLDIFRQNSVQTSKLDFIPNNHTFSVKANAAIGVNDTIINLKNISDSSPGLTFNLSVQPGDIVSGAKLLPLVGSLDVKVSSISRQRNTDVGTAVLDTAIGVARSVDGSVQIKKQNNASYSPDTGRFTFGTDIQFGFSDGDKITQIEILKHTPRISSITTSIFNSPATIGGTIYPLEVFDKAKNDAGQISFKLRKFNSPNSPVIFKLPPVTSVTVSNSSNNGYNGNYFYHPASDHYYNNKNANPDGNPVDGTNSFGFFKFISGQWRFNLRAGSGGPSASQLGGNNQASLPASVTKEQGFWSVPTNQFSGSSSTVNDIANTMTFSLITRDSPNVGTNNNSPSVLQFREDALIRFTRLNPVTQSEFLSIVPPNIRLDGGAEELYTFNQAIVANTGAGVTTLFRGFESVSDLYSVNTELGNDDDTYEETVAFQKPIRGINTSVDLTRDIVKTKLDKSKNYLNESNEEFIVEGVLKIQDPDKVNSPSGVVGFLNSPKGLVPAPYIGTGSTFNRAFSTFDGPWESNSTTSAIGSYVHGGSQPAESIFTKADSPANSDFVEQIQVPELAFKNTMIFEDFSSPERIATLGTGVASIGVNAAASAGGFNFKMPIKVEETDPDSGEKILVDYFLLLRQET